MARPERLHLVDGTFELYRAHFAPRPSRPLKATVGLANAMVSLLSEAAENVTHVAIAFDNPAFTNNYNARTVQVAVARLSGALDGSAQWSVEGSPSARACSASARTTSRS